MLGEQGGQNDISAKTASVARCMMEGVFRILGVVRCHSHIVEQCLRAIAESLSLDIHPYELPRHRRTTAASRFLSEEKPQISETREKAVPTLG